MRPPILFKFGQVSCRRRPRSFRKSSVRWIRLHVGKSDALEVTRVATLGTAIEKTRMSAICAIDRQR